VQRKPTLTRACEKCKTVFRTTIAKRVLCGECRAAEKAAGAPLFSNLEVACGFCAHAYVCKASYTGYACGLESVSTCKPYTKRILYKEGKPRPAR
jgi:hypothetical protein